MRALNQINDSVRRASEVISRVRALARKTNPVRRPERLNDIIKETLNVVHYEINHACQAMSGVEQHRRLLRVRTSLTEDEVTLEISDGGPGIDPDAFPSLFTPFFNTRESGMGMGLSICRSIIDFHEGKIWARNLINGASFFISRPKIQPPE